MTGANGFVGARLCAALVERGSTVRAVVRRAGSAPPGVDECVGDFGDPAFAAAVTWGARAVVSTAHPMGADAETQRKVGYDGTLVLARAAADAEVERFVHVSSAAVYDRSPWVGDVDEYSSLVGDVEWPYAVVKRDLDLALAKVDGPTRVLVRPTAVLGAGRTSLWNTLRPAGMLVDSSVRKVNPDQSFAWVHVKDLVSFIVGLLWACTAAIDVAEGPVRGGCTAVNVATGTATGRDYWAAVTRALCLEPVWIDQPRWTGQIVVDRALSWGWEPTVQLAEALEELEAGLRSERAGRSP